MTTQRRGILGDDAREEFSDILGKLLDKIPTEAWNKLSADDVDLLIQGISEINPSTILVPIVVDLVLENTPFKVDPTYNPRRRHNPVHTERAIAEPEGPQVSHFAPVATGIFSQLATYAYSVTSGLEGDERTRREAVIMRRLLENIPNQQDNDKSDIMDKLRMRMPANPDTWSEVIALVAPMIERHDVQGE